VRRERVGKEDDEVDPALGDRRSDLLVTTQRAAEIPVDRKFQLVGEDLAGCTRGE